jgi:adenine-specific DNA-methyltransferase
MANERLDRFTKLLKEIFELDKSDLDFGIYRVMNLRKTQIETFLTERLPQMVQETLAPFAQSRKEEIRTQMTQIEENVAGMDMTIDALSETAPMKQKYIALQKQLAEGADLAALETDVYSALYSFFNRYYEEGDFISKRRYKEGVYAIPYEGEEVKLYWANQDQYYIKTSENFKDYTFVFDGISVHFRLVDATTEQNNNKEGKDNKRVFMLFTEDEENYPGIKTFEYDAEAREIVIRFIYDIPEDKKRKYAEENYDAIQKWLLSLRDAELIGLLSPLPTGKGKETTTLLEKHLKGYVAKNTFDYFIHKDLRGFLTRELDFFIKSEVMHLEDLDTGSEARVETYLAKIKTIKRIGKIIIDFLAQIEDFQKKLWLKKKFVVETNWCITLDKIAEAFWSEIIANKAQIDEWISMYAIDEAEGWSNPPTVEFLRQNKNLIIDTKHFSSTFKYTLLESIPDLSEQTSGLMVQGDNIQALALLDTTFRGRVKCIHIDIKALRLIQFNYSSADFAA